MNILTNIFMVITLRVVIGYEDTSICRGDSRCACLQTSHGLGINVTCRCTPQDPEATLNLDYQSLPRNTGLLSIEGCRDIILGPGALTEKPYLTDVLIDDAGRIIFEPGSGKNIAASKTPGVHIRRCRELRIRTAAFADNARSPFSMEVSHCQSVHLQDAPFSRVRSIAISFINRLHLSSNAFRMPTSTIIERQSSNTEYHPVEELKGDIWIAHSRIVSTIPSSCFPSPLRKMELINVTTDAIGTNAVSGLMIDAVLIADSQIGEIAEHAFQQRSLVTSFTIRNTTIQRIRGRALSCAATSFILSDSKIGTIESLGVSMPAAKNSICNNDITLIKNGAFHMKSWNDLEIRNNTIGTVEKNAFINIRQPQLEVFEDKSVPIRFVIAENNVKNAQVGAFVFSAQTAMPTLEDNFFWHLCDCDLNKWSADLTQAVRSTDVAEVESLYQNNTAETGALWIGSALYNNSFCQVQPTESLCFAIQESFLPMANYTDYYCPKTRAAIECITSTSSKSEATGISKIQTDIESEQVSQTEVKKLDNRILMIIVLTVGLAILILIGATTILLVKKREHDKRRRSGSRDSEGLVTCSPLLMAHEEAGAMRSGSISKLSIADYKTSLLPPPEAEQQAMSLASQATDVTDIEDVLMDNKKDCFDSKTIDRGIQTDSQAMETITEDFAEAVLAAIKDKLQISPTYSEVRDKLFPKLDDLIRTPSDAANTGDLYTKPWLAEHDDNNEPIYSSILPKTNSFTTDKVANKIDSLTKAGLPPVSLDLTKPTAEEILNSLKSPPRTSSTSSQSSEEPRSPKFQTYNKKDAYFSETDSEKRGTRKTWVIQEPTKGKSLTPRTPVAKWPPPGYDATLKPLDTTKPAPRKSSGALSPTRPSTSPSFEKSTVASPPLKKDIKPAWRNGSLSQTTPVRKASREPLAVDPPKSLRKGSLKEGDSPLQSERRRSVRFSQGNTVSPIVAEYQSPSDALKESDPLSKTCETANPAKTSLNLDNYSLPRDQISNKQPVTYSEVSREVPLVQRPLPKRPDSDEPRESPSTKETENFYEQLSK
ncbi:uncharacterized protein LOC136040946 [Artemia franciscana]|uniref:uncharacterized protein LOC136040946 n=1 Tax=Artemia franciscana TaxID=6661 RepID=UPI0032DA1F6E